MTEPVSESAPAPRKGPKWVAPLVDYGALAAFFVVYMITRDMLTATWALVAGSVLAIALGYAVERRVAPMPLFAGLAGIVFGGLTLIFHDETFIKIKATVINACLGVAMLGGLAIGKNPLKLLLNSATPLTDKGWNTLALRFGIFYLCLAALNEVVWRLAPATHIWDWLNLAGPPPNPDDVWVTFRFPGLQIISVLFALTQVPMMMRESKAAEDTGAGGA